MKIIVFQFFFQKKMDNINALIANYFDSIIMERFDKFMNKIKSKSPEIFDFARFCIKTYTGQTISVFFTEYIKSKFNENDRTQINEDIRQFTKSCNDSYRAINTNYHIDEFFTKLYLERSNYQGKNISDFKKQFFSTISSFKKEYKELPPYILEKFYEIINSFENIKPTLNTQTSAVQQATIDTNPPVISNPQDDTNSQENANSQFDESDILEYLPDFDEIDSDFYNF